MHVMRDKLVGIKHRLSCLNHQFKNLLIVKPHYFLPPNVHQTTTFPILVPCIPLVSTVFRYFCCHMYIYVFTYSSIISTYCIIDDTSYPHEITMHHFKLAGETVHDEL